MTDSSNPTIVETNLEPGTKRNGRPKRLSILIWLSIACVLAVPIARWAIFEIDHQYANLASGGLLFVATVLGYIGVWFRFAKSVRSQTAILLAPVVFAMVAYTFFEFKGFTGETLPVFRLRSWNSSSSLKATVGSGSSKSSPDLKLPGSQYRSTQFLGTDRNGVVESPEFDVAWDVKLPKVLWRRAIGAGWSSFAIDAGLAITLEQIDENECITAFALTTGDVVWRVYQPGRHFQAFGGLGPRSTPTIDHDRLYAQTAMGIVVCLDLKTGELIWVKDLIQQAGLDKATAEKDVLWGRSGSPLVFDGQVVVPYGGVSGDPSVKSLISLDAKNGDILWTGGETQIAYSSPVLLNVCGIIQIVSVNEGNVTGHNPKNGDVLWKAPWPSKSNADACASQPVWVDSNHLLLGKGYALGSKLIELECSDTTKPMSADSWNQKTVWENTRILKTKFTNAIPFEGKLYALSDGVLECVNPENGSRIWRGKRYGQGQAIIVNGHLLVLGEDGLVAMIKRDASDGKSETSRVLGEMQVLQGITWNIPAVAGPYLLVRNAEEVVCLKSEKDADQDVRTSTP